MPETSRLRNELYKDPSGPDSPTWSVTLTNNLEMLQDYLLIARKKMLPAIQNSGMSRPLMVPTVSASSSLRTALRRLTRHESFILDGKSNIRRYEDVVFLSLIIIARLKVSQKQLTGSRRLERPFLMQNP
jgi:hypothetical protein